MLGGVALKEDTFSSKSFLMYHNLIRQLKHSVDDE